MSTPSRRRRRGSARSVDARTRLPPQIRSFPVCVDKGPQHLVVVAAVLQERPAEQALLNRAKLSAARRCRGRSPRRPGLRVDGCPPCRTRTRPRGARLPRTRPCPRTPNRVRNPTRPSRNPDDSDRTWKRPIAVDIPVGHDREADVAAGRPLLTRPRDEALKAFDGGRRRRDESRDFFRRQHREQGRRVAQLELAQRDARARQNRQRVAPVRFDDDRARRIRWRRPAGRDLFPCVPPYRPRPLASLFRPRPT